MSVEKTAYADETEFVLSGMGGYVLGRIFSDSVLDPRTVIVTGSMAPASFIRTPGMTWRLA